MKRFSWIGVLLVAQTPQVLGQGCAMCKTSIAAQSGTVVSALQSGILVLLVPPLAIMGAILYRVFGRDDQP